MQLIPSPGFMQILYLRKVSFVKSYDGWVVEIAGPLSDLKIERAQKLSKVFGFVMFAKNYENEAPFTVVSGYDFTHTLKCTDQ